MSESLVSVFGNIRRGTIPEGYSTRWMEVCPAMVDHNPHITNIPYVQVRHERGNTFSPMVTILPSYLTLKETDREGDFDIFLGKVKIGEVIRLRGKYVVNPEQGVAFLKNELLGVGEKGAHRLVD